MCNCIYFYLRDPTRETRQLCLIVSDQKFKFVECNSPVGDPRGLFDCGGIKVEVEVE
jgi:hypothetical protein